MDTVPGHTFLVVALDIVACDRTARRPRARHCRPAEAMAELVADDAAENAADHRAGA